MSRELIATDKNPYGGIKKKQSPPRPFPVCLSRCTLIILNKPGAAQLTIRKPCLQARGIHVSSHHHCRLHVLPILAPRWMKAGGAACPCSPLCWDLNQSGNRGFGKQNPSPIREPCYLRSLCPWAHPLWIFFQRWDFCGTGLLFPSWCYLLRACASSWHCFSTHRGKERPGNDECLASW